MSQENVEIGNLVNAAFNRGEVDAALEVFAPTLSFWTCRMLLTSLPPSRGLTESATR